MKEYFVQYVPQILLLTAFTSGFVLVEMMTQQCDYHPGSDFILLAAATSRHPSYARGRVSVKRGLLTAVLCLLRSTALQS